MSIMLHAEKRFDQVVSALRIIIPLNEELLEEVTEDQVQQINLHLQKRVEAIGKGGIASSDVSFLMRPDRHQAAAAVMALLKEKDTRQISLLSDYLYALRGNTIRRLLWVALQKDPDAKPIQMLLADINEVLPKSSIKSESIEYRFFTRADPITMVLREFLDLRDLLPMFMLRNGILRHTELARRLRYRYFLNCPQKGYPEHINELILTLDEEDEMGQMRMINHFLKVHQLDSFPEKLSSILLERYGTPDSAFWYRAATIWEEKDTESADGGITGSRGQTAGQNTRRAGDHNTGDAVNQNGRRVGDQDASNSEILNGRRVGDLIVSKAGSHGRRHVGDQNTSTTESQNGRRVIDKNASNAGIQNTRNSGNAISELLDLSKWWMLHEMAAFLGRDSKKYRLLSKYIQFIKEIKEDREQEVLMIHFPDFVLLDHQPHERCSWLCNPIELEMQYQDLLERIKAQGNDMTKKNTKQRIPDARNVLLEKMNGMIIQLNYVEVGVLYTSDILDIRLKIKDEELDF